MDRCRIEPYLKELHPVPTELEPIGNLPSDIKCILFDIYGTLYVSSSGDIGCIQSEPQKLDTIQDLLEAFQITISPEKLINKYIEAIKEVRQIIIF